MRILRDADGGEALSVRLRPLYDTVWKDGIDIERPSYLYKTLARRIAESENASLRAKLDEVDQQFSRVLHEMAGSVSLCWTPKPTGVFDTTLALEFVSNAIAELRAIIRQSAQAASQPSTLYERMRDAGYDVKAKLHKPRDDE